MRLSSPALRHLEIAAVACIVVVAVNAMFIDVWFAAQVTTLVFMVVGIFLSDPGSQELSAS